METLPAKAEAIAAPPPRRLRDEMRSTMKLLRFKGICWHRRLEKWQANICLNRLKIHIGYFNSEELAAAAYNQKAVELFGEFAALNDLARKPAECIKSPLDQ